MKEKTSEKKLGGTRRLDSPIFKGDQIFHELFENVKELKAKTSRSLRNKDRRFK